MVTLTPLLLTEMYEVWVWEGAVKMQLQNGFFQVSYNKVIFIKKKMFDRIQ